MASGSTGRVNSGFDFASDDILCTYDDFPNQDSSNGAHSDAIGANSGKDFNKTRMARPSAYSESSYNRPEDSVSPDMITLVERTMKKHNENIMRFLEGISSRLSQLELHCYNLDKSIGEMRSDLDRDNGEADTKLKTLEKHIQEVHRTVQILRDKQELADAQKELAKLQLVHKDSSSSTHSPSEEKSSPPDPKKPENAPEIHNPLAIELPHKILPSQAPPQQQPYYMPQAQTQAQAHHGSYMTPDPHYQTPQGQQFPQYHQQWPPQQPAMQPQMRQSSPSVYPTYPPQSQPLQSQPANLSPPEPPQPNSMSMPLQVSYAAVPQVPYGYAGPHSSLPPQQAHYPPPQQAHYPPGGYQPAGSTNMLPRNPPPYVRNHRHGELVDKFVSMGFRGDHVVSVIQRMEESGQPVDFNSVLDRLSSGGSQRGGGW